MLTFVPANAQHIGMRKEQQDSFAFSDPSNREFLSHGGLLAVVADGMGGLAGGAEASRAAVGAFQTAYGRKSRGESIQAALNRSLIEANTAVVAVARKLRASEGTGTTLAAVALHGSSLYWICAGDSRIYVLRGGQLARVNADHNQRTYLLGEVAAGRMGREAAWNDPEGPHLTSYLGIPEIQRIDFSARPFPVVENDIVLVCTDGVYRSLSEDEIKSTFARLAPAQACETLQAMTLAKGHSQQDNLTMIAVQCRGAAVRPPAAPARSNGSLLAGVLAVELLLAGGLTAKLVWRRYGPKAPVVAPKKAQPPTPVKPHEPQPEPAKQPEPQPAQPHVEGDAGPQDEPSEEVPAASKKDSKNTHPPADHGKKPAKPKSTAVDDKGSEHAPSKEPKS